MRKIPGMEECETVDEIVSENFIQEFDLNGYLEENVKKIYEYIEKKTHVENFKKQISDCLPGDCTVWAYYKQMLDAIKNDLLQDAAEIFNIRSHYGRLDMEIRFYVRLCSFVPLRDYLSKKISLELASEEGNIYKAICSFVYLTVDRYLALEEPSKNVQPLAETEAPRMIGRLFNRMKADLKKAGRPIERFVQNQEIFQNALMQEFKKDYYLTRPRSIGAQYVQYMAGNSHVARNRINYMNPNYEFEKLRDIAEDDIVRLLAHRAPGEEYKSIHPPLEEMEEPDCAVRQMVEPTEGAKAGDKIISVSFTASLQFAPITPYQRAWSAYCRYKGVDCGVSSGRTIIEARERDIEKITKEQVDSELYDTARTGLRGRIVYGHSVRLDANGMMFDALRRWARDERTGEVSYVKDMIGGAMDKEITLGKPMSEDDLRKRTTMYRNAQGGVWQEVDDPESMDVCAEIHWKRTVGGFQPWKKISDIKGGKKDVGVMNLKLFVPRGGVE